MTLEKYTKMFSNLRTDKGRNRYPAITRYRAPHKPFLLLSVMDLISQGQITTNFIAPSFDLLDTFNGYWSAVMPVDARTSMAYPFSRLSRPFHEFSRVFFQDLDSGSGAGMTTSMLRGPPQASSSRTRSGIQRF